MTAPAPPRVRLIFVRHTEPAWPAGWEDVDPGLSDRGRDQAEATAAELASMAVTKGVHVSAIYASPSRRARETAEVIAARLAIASVAINEAFNGFADPEARRKVSLKELDDDFLTRLDALQARAWAAVEAIRSEATEDLDAVIVGHDASIAAIVCRALSMPLPEMRRFRIDMGSLTMLDFRQQRIILALLNETCHLQTLP